MPPRSSLPSICIALGLADPESLLAHARNEYDAGERFFEFRLDYLARRNRALPPSASFWRGTPTACSWPPAAATRTTAALHGSIEEQIRILDAAREAGAQAVDVEIESAENCVERLAVLRTGALLC